MGILMLFHLKSGGIMSPFQLYLTLSAIVLFILLAASVFTVKQQTIAVIERFGRFNRMAGSGLRFRIPFIDQIVKRVNLRILQLDVNVETKTDDDVFVNVKVSVQYHVLPDRVYDAFYKLNNPEAQITSYVFDVIRAEIPSIQLDSVFTEKDRIAQSVKESLSDVMIEFGYNIVKSLITDIDPALVVKQAMNDKEAAKRLRQAAVDKAEAEKIQTIKQAEAEAESKHLQGEGIANQRKAIARGMRDSVETLQEVTDGSGNEVLVQLLITQYFDTLDSMTKHGKTNTIMVPHNPGGINSFIDEIRQVIISSNAIQDNMNK
jgi:regulator of protease activity HflC (stomatin/prohibitin superfamily)